MSDLDEFKSRLVSRLAAARKEPFWTQDESSHYMTALVQKRARFEELARHLITQIIRPRVNLSADHFGAKIGDNDPPERCSCWFGFSNRFPATTKVEFAIEHDSRFDKVVVFYQMYMMPVFIKYNEQDRLILSLDTVSDDAVASWTEDRLIEFLDSYLQIDRGEHELEEDVATDPVCGMRISRSEAAARDSYHGHKYFFCSEDCQRQFRENPKRFVRVATM